MNKKGKAPIYARVSTNGSNCEIHFNCSIEPEKWNQKAEKVNEFIKSGEVTEQSDIFDEFDISESVIDSLLIKTMDDKGNVRVTWGSQRIAA